VGSKADLEGCGEEKNASHTGNQTAAVQPVYRPIDSEQFVNPNNIPWNIQIMKH
jgi:hypothetical protein